MSAVNNTPCLRSHPDPNQPRIGFHWDLNHAPARYVPCSGCRLGHRRSILARSGDKNKKIQESSWLSTVRDLVQTSGWHPYAGINTSAIKRMHMHIHGIFHVCNARTMQTHEFDDRGNEIREEIRRGHQRRRGCPHPLHAIATPVVNPCMRVHLDMIPSTFQFTQSPLHSP